MHSHSNWWWQPSWILPCWIQTLPSWIQTPCYLLSDSLKNTLTPFWIWLKLIPSDSNLMMAYLSSWWQSILNSGHLGFPHFSFSFQSHSDFPRLVPTICTQNLDSFILTQLDDGQPSWILPCWIQTLPSWIQTPCYVLSDSLKNTLTPFWLWLKIIQSDSNSFILT